MSLWIAALLLALACFKCSDSGEWRKIERRGKKRKKGIGREEGFFPFSPCPQRFFSAAFLCTVPTNRTPGIGSSVASILGSGRKKIASHADVLRGTSCVPAPSTNNVLRGML